MKDRASMNAAGDSPASLDRQIPAVAEELGSEAYAFRDKTLLSPLISSDRYGLGGRQVVRSPGSLRLHPAFNELNLSGWLINSELQVKPQGIREPVLISEGGIIVAGFSEWHAAVCVGQAEIVCTECALNQDEALQLILTLNRPRIAWNDFTRTELALEQEPYFQSKAHANQIAGGQHKGLANLPKAELIDVREKIADLAGVCPRTVGNVKTILKRAHPSLIEALHGGTITINGAFELCKFERTQQIEELARFLANKSNSKTNRMYIDKLRIERIGADLTVFFKKLQQFEATNPGSVDVRFGTGKKTVITIGRDHLNALPIGIQADLG